MANWLSRILAPFTRAREGEVRPGPYLLSEGWLSASAGKWFNWWQKGFSVQPYGEPSAMIEACVSAYAQTVAMCPGDHWRLLPDGGRERVTTSALARILRRPNDYETISDFLLNLVDRWYRKGEAFAFAVRNDRNEIVELHRMLEGRPMVASDGSIFYALYGNEIAEHRFDLNHPIPARDVLHLRMNTRRHPLRGESAIMAVALDQAVAGAVRNQQLAFYLNKAEPGYVLETDQRLNAEQVRELREAWDSQTKGENAGGTPILTANMKAHTLTGTARDGQIAELLKMTDQNIALAFRMPLQVLGIGGTPFASTEALMASWRSTGLGFALNHIEEAIGQLFRLKGVPDEYLELDTDALLRSSFKEMIDALAAASGKIMTTNEARAKIGLGRKDGGDEIYVQMQDIPLAMAGKVQEQASKAEPKPEPDPPADEDDDPDLDDADAEKAARSIADAIFSEIKLLPKPEGA